MRLTLIFLGIFISLTGLAQDKKVVIELSPLYLIDFYNFPAVQGGIEFSLSKHVSWFNEFGLRYAKGSYENPDTNFISSKGLKAKTEVRYHFKYNRSKVFKRLAGYYVAANVFFLRDHHNNVVDYYFQKDTSKRKIDNFGVEKTVWGTNLLLGQKQTFGKHFLLNFYTGLGIRFREILTTNKEFNDKRDGFIGAIDLNIPEIKYKAESTGGKRVLPNLTFGIRLGYKL